MVVFVFSTGGGDNLDVYGKSWKMLVITVRDLFFYFFGGTFGDFGRNF